MTCVRSETHMIILELDPDLKLIKGQILPPKLNLQSMISGKSIHPSEGHPITQLLDGMMTMITTNESKLRKGKRTQRFG